MLEYFREICSRAWTNCSGFNIDIFMLEYFRKVYEKARFHLNYKFGNWGWCLNISGKFVWKCWLTTDTAGVLSAKTEKSSRRSGKIQTQKSLSQSKLITLFLSIFHLISVNRYIEIWMVLLLELHSPLTNSSGSSPGPISPSSSWCSNRELVYVRNTNVTQST